MRVRLLWRTATVGAILCALCFQGDLGAQGQLRSYIVLLRERPVAAYLKESETASVAKADLEGPAAASYRERLRDGQAVLKSRIEAMPGSRVRAQMDTVFNGMAVTLRDEDVTAIANLPEVSEIFPFVQYHKALDAALPLASVPAAWNDPNIGGEANAGRGIRIGVIDTGIDVNHPMFEDASLTPPEGFPRATTPTPDCFALDLKYTNSKVIVARNYVRLLDASDPNCDAEDRDGHGTFVAGIAAGRRVTSPHASIAGTAPNAFLGSYKTFGTPGRNDTATNAAIIKAIDDAVRDGMDIINLSLGAPADSPPDRDPIALAVRTADEAGVTVVVAAGNDGPGTGTVSSPGISPHAITAGAATNSRYFANPLVIVSPLPPSDLEKVGALPGNGPVIGVTIGPVELLDVQTLDGTGSACSPFAPNTIQGRLAFIRRGECNFSIKIQNAFSAGAIAALLYNNQPGQPPILMDVANVTQIPAAMIGNTEGVALKEFLARAGGPVRVSLGAQQQAIPTAANRLAEFSAEGPSTDFGIKPDLVAPGASIYSAFQRNDPRGFQFDQSGFGTSSGTSFAAPMVAGAAALVKQARPQFSPQQIRSALVNTATRVVTNSSGVAVGVLAQGNGLLDVAAAVQSTLTVLPVSISFGAQPPGTLLNSINSLIVTNVQASTDTFEVRVTAIHGGGRHAVTVSPASFSLEVGGTQTLLVTAASSQALNETVEGYLSIRSVNTNRSITVSYWGTFLRPAVNSRGVVNAASFASGPISVAAGGLISIFGTQMANETAAAVSLPLPTSLGGVRVEIDGNDAPLLFVSPDQINAQVPVEVSGRSIATLSILLNGVRSSSTLLTVAPAAPGIFTVTQNGQGRGAVLRSSDFSAVTEQRPARAGEILSVFATGLGSVTPSVESGSPASSSTLSVTRITPSATLGGISVPVRFSGLAPSFVGLYQVNIEVPTGLASGPQPLVLTSNTVASNAVTVQIGQ
jgi:uncharacterized protein (TIGR03437 family)